MVQCVFAFPTALHYRDFGSIFSVPASGRAITIAIMTHCPPEGPILTCTLGFFFQKNFTPAAMHKFSLLGGGVRKNVM